MKKFLVTVHDLEIEGQACLNKEIAKLKTDEWSPSRGTALFRQISEATNDLSSEDSLYRTLYIKSKQSLKVVLIVALIVNSRRYRNGAYYKRIREAVEGDGNSRNYKLSLEEELNSCWSASAIELLIEVFEGRIALPSQINDWIISQKRGNPNRNPARKKRSLG